MTVAAVTPLAQYIEDGTTMTFGAPFRYLDTTDLIVTRIVNDTATTLVLGTDYTATAGPTDAGGNVTLLTTVPNAKLRIGRKTERRQRSDFQNTTRFPSKTVELGYDRHMLIVQEIDADVETLGERSLQVPLGEGAPVVGSLASARTGQALGFVDGNIVPIEVGASDSKRIAWVTPEMFGAVGDAKVTYDGGGVAIAYAGTDDTVAVAAAFNAAMAAGAEVRLSRWYRITSSLPTMVSPYAIVGIGRFKCGLVMDAALVGAALTISECWLGKDSDEINSSQLVRDPAAIYSGPRLEGFSFLGSRSAGAIQHGLVLHRRVDKVRVWDVGAYHVRGCGLWMGYDDRAVDSAKASSRECDIQFEARWCGDLSGGYAAVRYWSYGWQVGDDASNNNVFDFEVFYSNGLGLHISGRNTNGTPIRFDRWSRVMVEIAGADTVLIEGNVVQSKWSFIETNPSAAGSYGIVVQEWSGNTSASAGAERMPRNLTLTGVNGGRTATSGIHVIAGKNIDFTNFVPSSFRAVGGGDYHLVMESTVSGVIALTGAASQGYAANVSCDSAALQWLRVDPGRMEASAASVPPIKSAAHSLTYVPDAFPGSTPGMCFSTGSAWVIWPVSRRNFRSDDTPVAAGSAQNRVSDVQVVGDDTVQAKLSIYNGFDGGYRLDWITPSAVNHSTLPYLSATSPSVPGGSGAVLSFTITGELQAPFGFKLIPPASNPTEPGSLYRETLGANNPLTYQSGAYATRQHLQWGTAAPTDGTWIKGDIVFNSAAAASGFVGWVCVTAGTPGTWKTFGAISA